MAELFVFIIKHLPVLVFGLFFLNILVSAAFWAMIASFVSEFLPKKSPATQSVESVAVNHKVLDSSPSRGTTKKVTKKASQPSKPVVESFSDEYKLPTNPFE